MNPERVGRGLLTWKGFAKGLLFCAGMIGGATAGHLFYLERYLPGATMFTLTALFLFYAMSDLSYAEGEDEAKILESVTNLQRSLAELALIVAENSINGAKRIGRTLPCTPAELASLEDTLIPLLNSLHVSRSEREHILQEFDKLRTRSRQSEGRRALSDGPSRLPR